MLAVVGAVVAMTATLAGFGLWLVRVGQSIGRIEQKIERLTGIELLVMDTRDRLARLEGETHAIAKPNGIGAH